MTKIVDDKGNKKIVLPCFDIVVEIEGKSGTITSGLRSEPCDNETEDSPSYLAYLAAIDALESMILAHAVAGVDITTPAYIEGIETAEAACAQNFSD